MIPPSVRARPVLTPPVSESRIKRITQITRITPHRPTAASSFPSVMSFARPGAIIRRDRPMCLPIPRPLSYEERGVASFDGLINGWF